MFDSIMLRGPLNKDFTLAFSFDYLTNSVDNSHLYDGFLKKNQEIIVNQTYFYYFSSKIQSSCSVNEIYDNT